MSLTPKNPINELNSDWSLEKRSSLGKSYDLYGSDFFFGDFGFVGENWNKVYGYSFVIYDVVTGVNHTLNLPINPSAISIEVPAATNLSVTMKGIVEEHNGAPLRRISISGTTGVLNMPFGGSNNLSSSLTASEQVRALFKNTIKSAQRVASTVNNFSKIISGSYGEELNEKVGNSEFNRTGYYFAHKLMKFLDYYLAAKKKKSYSGMRFQFAMHKDKMYYDCTLNSYSIRKAAGSLEYEYSIQLTAWRRTQSSLSVIAQNRIPSKAKDLNMLAKGLAAIRNARRLVNQSVGVLQGIRSDVDQSLLTPLREVILGAGEIVGAVNTALDFPSSMINNMKFSIENAVGRAKQASLTGGAMAEMGESLKTGDAMYPTAMVANSSVPSTQDALDSLANETEGNTTTREGSSPVDTIFNNQVQYQNFFDVFKIEELELTPELETQVQAEKDRVSAFTVDDYKKRRDLIQQYSASISQGLGGGNSTFARVYGQPYKKTNKTLNVDDITLLSSMNDLLMQVDSIVAFIATNEAAKDNDYYSYYAALAKESNVPFNSSNSKFFVPFPYGATLESLAVQYLGSVDRWIEISAINGLKAPYIDEVGFEIPFKSSGSGLNVLVENADRLYIGQTVQILSDTKKPLTKKVAKIDVLSSVDTVLTFDGTTTINDYILADNARIKAFLPDTVNSLKLIAIPSESNVSDSNALKTNPTKEDLDYLTSMAKIDFLLTEGGDLVFNSNGEIGLATGLQNIVQAARLKLLTKVGTIISDPKFGNPVKEGTSVADINAKEVADRIEQVFKDDPRYSSIIGTQVRIMGPTVSLDVAIGVAGSDYTLPLTVQCPL